MIWWYRATRTVPRGPHGKALWPEPAQGGQETCRGATWMGGHWPLGTRSGPLDIRGKPGSERSLAAAAQSGICEAQVLHVFIYQTFIVHLLRDKPSGPQPKDIVFT